MSNFTITNLPGQTGTLLRARLYSPAGAVVLEVALTEVAGYFSVTAGFTGTPDLVTPYEYEVRQVLTQDTAGWNAPTEIIVSRGFYGYLTGGSFTPSSDPALTTAGLVTRNGRGSPQSNIQIDFQLVDPSPSGSGTDAHDMRTFSVCSDSSGVLSTPLRQSTKYRARRGKGPWVTFTTGTDSTYALPELLGDAPQG